MKLHWHSMPVADIHMSGNFLYSVGAEGVLVRWDLESDDRQFLPRLGMPIRQLAVAQNEKYVVCGHSDNSKRFDNSITSKYSVLTFMNIKYSQITISVITITKSSFCSWGRF